MRSRGLIHAVMPVAALTLAAGCSGGGDPPPGSPGGVVPMRLVAYDGCADLLDGLRGAAAERVGPYGLPGDAPGFTRDGTLERRADGNADGDRAAGAAPQAPSGAEGSAAQAAPPEHSGTNVHEQGVDEPDMVKTDGRRIVVLARGALHVIDAATRKEVGKVDLASQRPGTVPEMPGELLLTGDRAMVITKNSATQVVEDIVPAPRRPAGPRSRLQIVDLKGTPRVAGSLETAGTIVDARQVGGTARVVVSSRPRIEFPLPEPGRPQSRTEATEHNRRLVQQAPLSAWLPSFQVSSGGAARTYTVPCDRVSHPAQYAGTSMLTVLTLDMAREPGDPQPVSVATDGDTVYGTGSSLYIAGTPPWSPAADDPGGPARTARPQAGRPRTDIHRFDISGGGRPRYAASGSVPGTLLNQYSLSEYGGHLRIATTSSPSTGPGTGGGASAVYVLRQDGARLRGVGEVGGLGKGERIYAVRFLGPRGYVVTFRQTDPLYSLDLRDPRRPRVTGELKINGYSAYLHPTADGRLIGVGQDADAGGRVSGTQVSLFDVSGAPRRLDRVRLPGTGAAAESDPHAFLYWPQSGLTVVPVSGVRGSEALVMAIGGDRIRRMGSIRGPADDFAPILRSLIVGDTLWTVSTSGARAHHAGTLADRGGVDY